MVASRGRWIPVKPQEILGALFLFAVVVYTLGVVLVFVLSHPRITAAYSGGLVALFVGNAAFGSTTLFGVPYLFGTLLILGVSLPLGAALMAGVWAAFIRQDPADKVVHATRSPTAVGEGAFVGTSGARGSGTADRGRQEAEARHKAAAQEWTNAIMRGDDAATRKAHAEHRAAWFELQRLQREESEKR